MQTPDAMLTSWISRVKAKKTIPQAAVLGREISLLDLLRPLTSALRERRGRAAQDDLGASIDANWFKTVLGEGSAMPV